jgi:hypothetical protein
MTDRHNAYTMFAVAFFLAALTVGLLLLMPVLDAAT